MFGPELFGLLEVGFVLRGLGRLVRPWRGGQRDLDGETYDGGFVGDGPILVVLQLFFSWRNSWKHSWSWTVAPELKEE